MFKSILDTFMRKDPKLSPNEQLNPEVLNPELLADNFHDSLDLPSVQLWLFRSCGSGF
jgi:hypothetical protein